MYSTFMKTHLKNQTDDKNKDSNESDEKSVQLSHSHLLMHEKNMLNKEIFNTQQRLKKLEMLQYEALIKYNIPVNRKDFILTSSPCDKLLDFDLLNQKKESISK